MRLLFETIYLNYIYLYSRFCKIHLCTIKHNFDSFEVEIKEQILILMFNYNDLGIQCLIYVYVASNQTFVSNKTLVLAHQFEKGLY